MSAATLVQSLTEYAADAENEYDASAGEFNPERLVILLCAIRDARADLGALAKKVEMELLATAGEKRFVVDGLGEVEIRRNTKRTAWDNDELMKVVVARALDERRLDEETGEYERESEVVARVVSECSRPSWRLTPLRARGIQIDEFCHESADGYAVQLPPRGI